MNAITSKPESFERTVNQHGQAICVVGARESGKRMSPWVYGVLTAMLFFSLAAVCLYASHRVSQHVLKQTLDEEIKTIAKIAAMSIDGDAHARLTRPEQLNGPEYVQTVQPLRDLQRATKRIKYLYTVRIDGAGAKFAIDAAQPEDEDGDGVIDQAQLGETYEEPDPCLFAAFEARDSRVSQAPYTDKWGTFISGFAPVYRGDGELECFVGVDMTVDEYLANLARMDRALYSGVAVAAAASSGLGFVVVITMARRQRMETMLRAARVAAEEASRAKSAFLANMSHEIRTPMTAILGLTELLDESELQGDAVQRSEVIATIKHNGQVLLTIINDILDLSKIEEGKMSVEQVATSPSKIVQEVAALLDMRAKEKGIFLSVAIADDVPEWIVSDPVRLRQIFINLISNAIKFTQVGGVKVLIEYAVEAGQPVLVGRVEDTGIGMTPEQCGRLFQAFEQADASTTRKFGGTGLGLRISRSLAKMLGGDISVFSEIGKGSTFVVKVAALAVPAAEIDGEHVASDAKDAGSACVRLDGLRILVTEDGPENRRLIGHHLRKAGATVEFAENGREAIERLCEGGVFEGKLIEPSEFDLLILDMQMPVMDGYATATELRLRGSELPIVALTAHAMSGEMEKCLAAGCSTYATKPLDKVKLVATCGAFAVRRGDGGAGGGRLAA